VLLGFREVRSIAMAASIMDLFASRTASRFSLDLFWGHSIAVAVVAESLAKETGFALPEEAFTAGVMHDIGKLVLNQYMPQEYAQVVDMAIDSRLAVHQAELRVLGFSHAQVGGRLADRWQFPESLTSAIGDHHHMNVASDTTPLTYIVTRADALCREYGLWAGFEYPTAPPDHATAVTDDPLREALLSRLGGMEAVETRAKSFLTGTLHRPFAWYQKAGCGMAAAAEPAPADAVRSA
jgi:putative nucleotidyltransferase with HDIG domain